MLHITCEAKHKRIFATAVCDLTLLVQGSLPATLVMYEDLLLTIRQQAWC